MKGGRSSWEECVFFIPFCKWLPYGIIWYVYVVLLPISLNAIGVLLRTCTIQKLFFLNYYDFKMQHFSYIWSDVEIWLSRETPTWNVRTRMYVYVCIRNSSFYHQNLILHYRAYDIKLIIQLTIYLELARKRFTFKKVCILIVLYFMYPGNAKGLVI